MKRKLLIVTMFTFGLLVGCADSEKIENVKDSTKEITNVAKEEAKDVVTEEVIEEVEPFDFDGITAYGESSMSIMETYEKQSNRLQTLFETAEEYPLVVLNDEWRSEINKAYDKLEESRDEMAKLDVPEELELAHKYQMESMDLMIMSRDKIMGGIEERDENMISEGWDLINESNIKLQMSSEETDKLTQELNDYADSLEK